MESDFGFSPGAWVLLLGWPALLAAVIAMTVAVSRRSRPLAWLACILVAPMSFYLALAPRFRLVAPLAFISFCIASWAVRSQPRAAVVLLALPIASLLVWLAVAVVLQ